MYAIRRAAERGQVNLGWLTSQHSFSFGHYYDPNHMGVSVLRVINDDNLAPSRGFDTHGHRDMEIISYVTRGALKHKDSEGNEHVVKAGEIQRMSAGTGVMHSECNASEQQHAEFLQIWITPKSRGIAPSYQQKSVPQQGALTPIVTADGAEGSLSMHQDAQICRLLLNADETQSVPLTLTTGYLHLIRGKLSIDGHRLVAGDGLRVDQLNNIQVSALEASEALWFDLPAEN